MLLISLILYLQLKNFNNIFIIGIGLSLTIFYLTLEGILQGFRNFKLLSFVNFVFYTLSLNVPSIVLLSNNNFNFEVLIKFSILIKIFSIIIILFYLKKFFKFNFSKNSKYNFSLNFRKYSKWYSLHLLNLQIFDFMDKYLIKLFIGPIALAIYSIPYQLAGKLTILSKSISAVLLPEISNSNEKTIFNHSLNTFSFVIPFFLLIAFFFLDKLLIFWLQNQYSETILELTKIFLIISWISGISHILITFFEGKKKLKFNTILEIYFLFPFLLVLFYVLIQYENLIYVSFILLLKEMILLIFRTNKIKKNIYKLQLIYLNIIIVIINLLINIYYNQYFIYSFILLILFNSFLFIEKRYRK